VRAITFLRQFLAAPNAVGAVAPSSRGLAEAITEAGGVPRARTVVEFGPGTGVFTEAIVRKLGAEAWFLAIEVNPRFVGLLRERMPAVRVVRDSAANAPKYLREAGRPHCDCVVSGLPWASFDTALQDALLDVLAEILGPGGRFVTFSYVHSPWLPAGKRFRGKLERRFAHVERTPVVWRNLPPAFVYCAQV